MTFLQELLTFVGLQDRLHLEWVSSAEAQKFAQVMTDFTEKIRALGPNPLRPSFKDQMLPRHKTGVENAQKSQKVA
jgi:F420-non-reducing hydrogenase iron-sulfur subunit